jgi:predicted deacylase
MRSLITVFLLLLSQFTLHAQSIRPLLGDLKNGQRLDTLIRLGSENEVLPLTLIKGAATGPVFTIVAGIHGYEYPPIIATQELLKEIDPARLRGTLIVIPIADMAAFYKRSPFVNPADQKNLNTAFPGSANGTITEKTAHWITQEVIPVSEVFLDIHGGDASEDLLPFICYYDNKDAKTEKARRLSEASGMEYIVSYPYTISKTEPARYAFKQAVQHGTVALSIEAGKLGTVQSENVALIKSAVYNMLDYAAMYTTKRTAGSVKKKVLSRQTYIRVPDKGLFYSTVRAGDEISEGEQLGYITDPFGTVINKITAPVSGIVLYKVGTPPVNPGETLFCIGMP